MISGSISIGCQFDLCCTVRLVGRIYRVYLPFTLEHSGYGGFGLAVEMMNASMSSHRILSEPSPFDWLNSLLN